MAYMTGPLMMMAFLVLIAGCGVSPVQHDPSESSITRDEAIQIAKERAVQEGIDDLDLYEVRATSINGIWHILFTREDLPVLGGRAQFAVLVQQDGTAKYTGGR